MISKKGLVALIVIIALIGTGIYFALSYNPPEKVEEEAPNKELSTIVVYEKDVNNLKEINVKLFDEEFAFVSKNGEFVYKDNANVTLKYSNVMQLASDVSIMSASKVIEEDASDLEKYGFNNPKAVITAVFDDETKVIKIGGQTTDDAYFMHIEGETKVYTIYSTRGDLFTQSFSYYREFNVLKVTGTALVKAQVKNGEDVLTVENKDGRWYVTNPIFKDVNETVLNEKVFANISYFMAKEYLDETSLNYEKYGLLNPSKSVYIEDSYGVKQTFYFGNTIDDKCYVKMEGKDGVFTMDISTMDVFDVKATQMVDTYVNLPNIKDVKKITVSNDGKTYTIERNEENGSAKYKINGKIANEEAYRQIYMGIIGISMSDFCNEIYTNNLYAKVVFEYNDSTVRTFEYMDFSSRQAVVYENKKSVGYVQKTDINNMISLFN